MQETWHKYHLPSDEEVVEAIQEEWRRISYDILDACAQSGETTLSGKDAREIVSDYIQVPGWWDLPFSKRDELLLKAMPSHSYCA